MSEIEKNILVVDDDEFIRDLLFRHLSQSGYQVSVMEKGAEAIEAVRMTGFQVALIDVLLPEMDGIQLVDKLKVSQPDIVIIMMTGHPSLETALEAMRRGVNDYLIKPFKLEQLDEILYKSFERRKILLENRKLRTMVEELREKLKQYEALIGYPQFIHAKPKGDNTLDRVRGDAVYRFQSSHNKRTELHDRLDKLALLKEEGIISEDEFNIRQRQLLSLNGNVKDEGTSTEKTN